MIERASSTPVMIRPASIGTSRPDPEALPRVPRRARLRPEDFLKFGYTVGCPGCEQLQLQLPDKRNHNETCRLRMELELTKADNGKHRFGKAKDRLDTRTAEIGQQILEETTEAVQPEGEIQPPTPRGSGIDGHQFSQSRMGNEEADEDDVANIFGNFEEGMDEDQLLAQAPAGQKRRNDTPQNDSGKHLRPRSPRVSYQSDGPPPSIDERMLDSSNTANRRIMAAAIMGVDITDGATIRPGSWDIFRLDQRLGLYIGGPQEESLDENPRGVPPTC